MMGTKVSWCPTREPLQPLLPLLGRLSGQVALSPMSLESVLTTLGRIQGVGWNG